MHWIYLLAAGCFEIGFASTMKLTEGYTKPVPTTLFIVCTILSFTFLERATATIPIGTAYAVWTGIGAIGAVIVGIAFYGEPATLWRIFFLSTLVMSVVGLKLVSQH
ncbi:MAG: multidrug efflux SMR transporter [Candidatus Hydrogenedentes bacterium]|nr:multidrug efflux SMR transporter [Candidatus Hydrogenedentota bacterium]